MAKWCLREQEKSKESVTLTDVSKGELPEKSEKSDDKPAKNKPVDVSSKTVWNMNSYQLWSELYELN